MIIPDLATYATFSDMVYFDRWHVNVARRATVPFVDWIILDYYV